MNPQLRSNNNTKSAFADSTRGVASAVANATRLTAAEARGPRLQWIQSRAASPRWHRGLQSAKADFVWLLQRIHSPDPPASRRSVSYSNPLVRNGLRAGTSI